MFVLSYTGSSVSFLGYVAASVNDLGGAQVFDDQPEIIFIGTGTSEGIPRVSCLTDPNKKCPVSVQIYENMLHESVFL